MKRSKIETGTLVVNGSCLGPAERDPATGNIELGPNVTERSMQRIDLSHLRRFYGQPGHEFAVLRGTEIVRLSGSDWEAEQSLLWGAKALLHRAPRATWQARAVLGIETLHIACPRMLIEDAAKAILRVIRAHEAQEKKLALGSS